MRLLCDTDIFCKLSAVGLWDEAALLLNADPAKVERLPALPHMLRRGRLRERLGAALAEELAQKAALLPTLPPPPAEAADLLKGNDKIDAGEVALLSWAAVDTLLLMSGDKRALEAVARQVPLLVPKLSGKIVCFEALLLALCQKLGVERVYAAVEQRRSLDTMLRSCFSSTSHTLECLQSHLRSLSGMVAPLVLWLPMGGDA